MMNEKLHPTPNGLDCPVCKKTNCLIYAVDCTRYYRVTRCNPEEVAGYLDTTETGEEVRLFCDNCGEYFEPPGQEDLS